MNRDKILGVLYGAAYGDSFGAVTEFCTRAQILEKFPDGLKDYHESISFITKGLAPGSVTDDFGSSCYLMRHIIKNNGNFNREIAKEVILDWAEDELYFGRFAGMNSKAAVEALREGREPERRGNFAKANTNGGAMKVSPLGILASGERELALQYGIDICHPTHYNSAAVSGATAICCSRDESLSDQATRDSVIEASIWGGKGGMANSPGGGQRHLWTEHGVAHSACC